MYWASEGCGETSIGSMMHINKIFRPAVGADYGISQIILPPVGADYAVSKNKTDFEIGPSTVTLSRSEGSVAPASRCFVPSA